ncbi:MAG: alpha (1,3)-fucosyltransferase [Solivirus sp.]|uniref:Alpha (1,3)-fucosyltransferase n=1 Tax=Solivirus sp. TaxID=2487772 RepID=A0A3G5AFP7_9VIRU|nr:MAG: alpha (1,3)-fucosyltransferase [Solivirus sp.]
MDSISLKFGLVDFPPDQTVNSYFLTDYLCKEGHQFVPIEEADCLICCDWRGDMFKYSTTYFNIPKILISGENLYFWVAQRFHSRDNSDEARKIIHKYLDQFDLAFITVSEFSSENDSVKIIDFDGKVLNDKLDREVIHLPYATLAYDLPTLISVRDINPDKTKFCCFCVTNGSQLEGCIYRDTMFRELSKYKMVESLGNHLNNVGGVVPKENFDRYVSQYKFMICFENSTADGYITEKIMRCFVAGIVPIYWGTRDIFKYVNPKSFVFVDCQSPNGISEAIERIKYLDTHEAEYFDMLYEEPFVNQNLFNRKNFISHLAKFIERGSAKFIESRKTKRVTKFERKQWPGTENTKFILQMKNCKAYAFRREMQRKTWCKDIPDYFTWWHVIGDPTLKEAVYKPEENLLIVPAPDTYEGLPQKCYETYKFAYINFPSALGLMETDDDAIIDMKRFIEILDKNTWRNYYGRFVHHHGGNNFYGYDVVKNLDQLPREGVKTKEIDYIVGCCIYISNKAIAVAAHRPQFFTRPIYCDLYLAEALEDTFKAERDIQLYGDKFDFEYPMWILNRQNPQVPNFFEKMDYYYNIFVHTQKYLIVAENWPELETMKRYYKEPFEFVSAEERDDSKCPEGYSGALILKKSFYVDFHKLHEELIQLLIKGDFYTNEHYELYNEKRNKKSEGKRFELVSLKSFETFSLQNFFDFSQETVFKEVIEQIKLKNHSEALRLCDTFFFDSQFYSSYYQAAVYVAMKNEIMALSMALRCLTLAELETSFGDSEQNSGKFRQEYIYRFILKGCSAIWTKEHMIYFARRALEAGFEFSEIYHELFFCGYGTHLSREIVLAAGLAVIDNRKSTTSWQVWNNFGSFAPKLKGVIHQLTGGPTLPKEYTSSSLAIANFDNVIVGILRTHTYRVEGTSYISNCEDGIIRTVNYYLTINEKLEVIRSQEIELIDKKPYETRVRGLEDVRIIDRDRILGVTYEHIENEARTMAYYELKNSEDGTKKIGDYPTVMKTPEACEKNWLPLPSAIPSESTFNHRETSSSVNESHSLACETGTERKEPKFIYSLSPTRIVSLEATEVGIKKLHSYEQNFDDERGSSLLKYNFNGIEGYLVLTHRVIFLQTRIYLNRFFFLSSEYKILYSSNYFHFLHIGIEYCLGLCYSFNKENLYAAVSKSDKETYIVEFAKETVENMLRPIGQKDKVFGISPISDLKRERDELTSELKEREIELNRIKEELNDLKEKLKSQEPETSASSTTEERSSTNDKEEQKKSLIKKKIPKRLRYK